MVQDFVHQPHVVQKMFIDLYISVFLPGLKWLHFRSFSCSNMVQICILSDFHSVSMGVCMEYVWSMYVYVNMNDIYIYIILYIYYILYILITIIYLYQREHSE